nr:hypothetical protein 25 [bacterium]
MFQSAEIKWGKSLVFAALDRGSSFTKAQNLFGSNNETVTRCSEESRQAFSASAEGWLEGGPAAGAGAGQG